MKKRLKSRSYSKIGARSLEKCLLKAFLVLESMSKSIMTQNRSVDFHTEDTSVRF